MRGIRDYLKGRAALWGRHTSCCQAHPAKPCPGWEAFGFGILFGVLRTPKHFRSSHRPRVGLPGVCAVELVSRMWAPKRPAPPDSLIPVRFPRGSRSCNVLSILNYGSAALVSCVGSMFGQKRMPAAQSTGPRIVSGDEDLPRECLSQSRQLIFLIRQTASRPSDSFHPMPMIHTLSFLLPKPRANLGVAGNPSPGHGD
jgi:hypothetical protein